MTDLYSQVDQYCERTNFDFLSEPLNLYSNGLFWLAVVLAWGELRRRKIVRRGGIGSLMALVFLVGLGSGLFHSYATIWAEICDVGFIALFVVCYLWLWARQVMRVSWGLSAILMGLFFATSAAFSAVFQNIPVNGSQGYFGVAFFLFILGLQEKYQLSGSTTLIKAASVFVLSLIFRTWDQELCALWPYGTHFLWHGGNALVCYLTLRAMSEELEWHQGYRSLNGLL